MALPAIPTIKFVPMAKPMKLHIRKQRLRFLAGVAGLSHVMLFDSCANKKDEHTYVVDYSWNSKVRLIHVKDSISGEEIRNPRVLEDINRFADQELPGWIALSKLKIAEGTFHIQFLGGGKTPKSLRLRTESKGKAPNSSEIHATAV